jgi:hypothetical protein
MSFPLTLSLDRKPPIQGSPSSRLSLLYPLNRPRVSFFPAYAVRRITHHLLRRLREIDIELMRRLAPRVNVIPVIGKSDTLTMAELRDFKQRVSPPCRDNQEFGVDDFLFGCR